MRNDLDSYSILELIDDDAVLYSLKTASKSLLIVCASLGQARKCRIGHDKQRIIDQSPVPNKVMLSCEEREEKERECPKPPDAGD